MLFFINVGSRRVILADLTPNPTAAWVVQQAHNVAMELQDHKATYLIRDNDSKFTAAFDDVFKAQDVDVVRTCVQAPNMNAFIERWLQSLQVECLDNFVVFGEDHFRYLIASCISFYHGARPHQSLNNLPLDGTVTIRPLTGAPSRSFAPKPSAES